MSKNVVHLYLQCDENCTITDIRRGCYHGKKLQRRIRLSQLGRIPEKKSVAKKEKKTAGVDSQNLRVWRSITYCAGDCVTNIQSGT